MRGDITLDYGRLGLELSEKGSFEEEKGPYWRSDWPLDFAL